MSVQKNRDKQLWEHSAPSSKRNWTDSNKNSFDNDIEQFSHTTAGGGCALTTLVILGSLSLVVLALVVL